MRSLVADETYGPEVRFSAGAGLIERGVFVRMPGVAPLDRCIRVSCGTQADMDAFGAALPPALDAANS